MKQTKLLMGMPITVELVDPSATQALFDETFNYFQSIDETFSTYKPTSEVSRLNAGELTLEAASTDVQTIFELCDVTKRETNGYFDCVRDGKADPSGIVKGWSIWQAAQKLSRHGMANFYIEAGGDIQAVGRNSEHKPWQIGIRHPFEKDKSVKTLAIYDRGVATSGSYERGDHVYDPYHPDTALHEVVSTTVIGPNIYEADRFATAAFAMGLAGIEFIESLKGFEAYQIDKDGHAIMTSHFEDYVVPAEA